VVEGGFDEISFPLLLRAARQAYGTAIQLALTERGCDDVPRNGAYLLACVAGGEAPLAHVVRQFGTSKQAAGQLVEILVARGYLTRSVDNEDRRRLTVALTERGAEVAEVVRTTVQELDAELLARVGPECVAQTRATLTALVAGDGL
jgi:DNA-binding MarR family transcriptional regulator